MPDPARSRFGHDMLFGFNVADDSRDFLADVIESNQTPEETEQLLQLSLLAGAEDWQYLIDCAKSLRRARVPDPQSLNGQDVLQYVSQILDEWDSPAPWAETDRLIALAKQLQSDSEIQPSQPAGQLSQPQQRLDLEALPRQQPPARAKGQHTTSHYWSDQPQDQRPEESHRWSTLTRPAWSSTQAPVSAASHVSGDDNFVNHSLSPVFLQSPRVNSNDLQWDDPGQAGWGPSNETVRHISTASPYFATEDEPSTRKRPPRGTVAAVPFAPLTSPTFGLIQEQFAHDPFWLLIAVTFLIRTKGVQAIPVFHKVKQRFPTPAALADPANAEELINMIRHLGLSAHRVALMQKYARGFLTNPPRAGKTYKVKNYDRRDFDPSAVFLQDINHSTSSSEEDGDDTDAWEIGHLTKGKYAIDSWRIFCRDQLLGRATDWNGGGQIPEFQPEWMRVRPSDKELRAYLRWMWMKEGWEWDPVSGEHYVLREELQRAVNEGRVEYDDTGGLRILG
ncbi:5-methylcytosine G T mismatch-specific DNA glycosylase [Fusarium albosuccineum]|uniref:5-methylcytosine G T mismatch-specific DNA glycosylase n=1 Tax=Fusarium albosuccineum TaxID=1237068 RepID=A0A8H4LRC1_9HYPO|nr:5-methylcytosine G T mismatch-specific DNA glycosylase [Fusarium albosuccineum]